MQFKPGAHRDYQDLVMSCSEALVDLWELAAEHGHEDDGLYDCRICAILGRLESTP